MEQDAEMNSEVPVEPEAGVTDATGSAASLEEESDVEEDVLSDPATLPEDGQPSAEVPAVESDSPDATSSMDEMKMDDTSTTGEMAQ
jgi:hypothetical protein